MVAISLTGGFAAAQRLTSAVRIFTHAVSLGGVDSLIQHPAALTHRPVAAEARPLPNLVRLSIGLECAGDLINDLAQAFAPVASSHEEIAPGSEAADQEAANPVAANPVRVAASESTVR